MDIAKNFAKATLSQGYEAADTAIDVLTGEGARFPPAPFNAVWWNATDYPDPSDDPLVEIVRVTDVTDETLTVTRAQEGTAAEDHNFAGKTYKIIAGLTAIAVNVGLVGDVHGNGPAVIFDQDLDQVQLRQSSARNINMGTFAIEIQSTMAFLGDFAAEQNNAFLGINDDDTLALFNNLNLATTQSESATGPVGTVVGKLAIRNGAGDIIGYLPIYSSIT